VNLLKRKAIVYILGAALALGGTAIGLDEDDAKKIGNTVATAISVLVVEF
jgi:hypothetical protein